MKMVMGIVLFQINDPISKEKIIMSVVICTLREISKYEQERIINETDILIQLCYLVIVMIVILILKLIEVCIGIRIKLNGIV